MKRKEFSFAAKYRWFSHYIEPLLTKKPKGQTNLTILLDLAERAFLNRIGKNEIDAVKEYLKICEKIYKDDPEKIIELTSIVLSDIEFEATSRLNEAIEAANSEGNEIRADITLYAALVENFVRAFISPIYYFTHKAQSSKGGPQSPDDYVRVSISEKEKNIASAVGKTEGFDVSKLISGLDMRIRHGGAGHEHWTVLDDQKVELKLISASTGAVRETIVFTKRELSEKLKSLEKLVWVLRAGFYIFLSNSDIDLGSKKPRTKSGVEKFSKTFAEGRLLNLQTPFQWNEVDKEVVIEVSYTTPKKGTTVEIMMPQGKFSVVYYEFDEILKYHLIDVIKNICLLMDTDKYGFIKVKATKNGTEVLNSKYRTGDLVKKIDEGGMPTPIEGKDISEEIKVTWIGEFTVPCDLKDVSIESFKKDRPDYRIL